MSLQSIAPDREADYATAWKFFDEAGYDPRHPSRDRRRAVEDASPHDLPDY